MKTLSRTATILAVTLAFTFASAQSVNIRNALNTFMANTSVTQIDCSTSTFDGYLEEAIAFWEVEKGHQVVGWGCFLSDMPIRLLRSELDLTALLSDYDPQGPWNQGEYLLDRAWINSETDDVLMIASVFIDLSGDHMITLIVRAEY